MTVVDFPDISHHNPAISYPALRAAGATQVAFKATEAGHYTDPTFRSNWVHSKAAGLNRTAYHFARPGTDPVMCARSLHALAADAELPLCLDWEDASVSIDWAKRFLLEADQLTGRKTVLYLPQSWCSRSGALVDWPIWVARYNRTLGNVRPWAQPTWWQYTDKGHLGPHFGDVSHGYVDLATPAAKPKPPEEEDLMPRAVRSAKSGATYVLDAGTHARWQVKTNEDLQAMYLLGMIRPDPKNTPPTVSSEFIGGFRNLDAA